VVYLDDDGDLGNSTLDSNDDGGDGFFSELSYTFRDDGVYYYAVEEYSPDAVGEYEMEIVATQVLFEDNREPDDNPSALDPIAIPLNSGNTFYPVGDMDYFRLDVAAGDSIGISAYPTDTYPVTGGVDIYLSEDGTMTNLLASDFESLTWTFDTAGSYYIILGDANGEVGEYTLEVYYSN
jgi:hypothetical protein